MKILTVVGARPQFIKASAISREIKSNFSNKIEEVIVHTGQHFDQNMSAVFFNEFQINKPKYNLNISCLTHGAMTGKMLEALEQIYITEQPDLILVYGDTNSTLAGALSAVKLHIPVAHVEAGLRSFNRNMPEEINRVVTDTISSYLFCPTERAIKNLAREGIKKNVCNVGDVMLDVALFMSDKTMNHDNIMQKYSLKEKEYILVTFHREENTNFKEKLYEIMLAIHELSKKYKIVFPIHPRTKKFLTQYNFGTLLENVLKLEPLSYSDLLLLEKSAKFILTDSGGVQKEAFFYQVPCITIRNETEWVETLELGWNKLVNANCAEILNSCQEVSYGTDGVFPYGNGKASKKILEFIMDAGF